MREGILVDYIGRHLPDLADPPATCPTRAAAACWTWPAAATGSRTTASTSPPVRWQLFDALRPLHRLGTEARELIEYGALLHDIGWHVGPERPPQAQHVPDPPRRPEGSTPEEMQVIANVARYHRKSPPKPEHADFQTLSPKAKQIVLVGGALLRMADGLDRSHGGMVREVKAKVGPGKVRFELQGKGDMELELWGRGGRRTCSAKCSAARRRSRRGRNKDFLNGDDEGASHEGRHEGEMREGKKGESHVGRPVVSSFTLYVFSFVPSRHRGRRAGRYNPPMEYRGYLYAILAAVSAALLAFSANGG